MIKRRILAGLLTLIMVLQALAPGTALAKVSKPSNNNLITIGSLTKKDYPQIDKDTALRVAREQKNKRKGFLGRGGAGFFSAGSPYIPGQQPGDTDKPKYLANITGKVEAKGLDDGDFDWNKIFGDKPIKLELRQLDKTKANPQTNPLGETGLILTLEVNKAGEFKLTDRAGNLTELPLFSADGNPFEYQIQVDRKSYENVELIISTNAGTPGSKFEPVGDKQIATLFFTIGIQQLASTKFVSEWHTGVAEADRPQIEGYFKIDDETDSGFNFPNNDTIRTILRSAYEENFEEDEEKGFWSFIDSELETTPETVEVKTDTAGLTFEEKDGVKTVKSGDHKFKYDFKYDVINGGKLTMTEILPVTFDANGGKFANFTAPDTETEIVKEVEYGKDLTDKAENPTKDRETFKGWSTTADGKNPVTDADFKNITTAKTFYAIWGNNEITAEELEVKESFKDGETWVNNFIPKEEDLKAAVKVIDANGNEVDLPEGAKVELVDDSGDPYADEAALANALYDKLQEKDNPDGKPTRMEAVKAKVTFKNGEVQTVEIPIKVYKNIYEAKTETKPPYYVPKDYVKVTLDPTTNAQDPQKTYYYVNKDAQVVIPGKNPVGTSGHNFINWTIPGTPAPEEYKLADRHQFSGETIVTANYVDNVVEQIGKDEPKVPDDFVKVIVDTTDDASNDTKFTRTFWVKKDTPVRINVKDPVYKDSREAFAGWKDKSTDETVNLDQENTFTKDVTEIEAFYGNLAIPQLGKDKPDNVPKNFIRVFFDTTDKAKVEKRYTWWVAPNNPSVKLTLDTPVGKDVKDGDGVFLYKWKFYEWENKERGLKCNDPKKRTYELDTNKIKDGDVFEAEYELDFVIPYDPAAPFARPEGYARVTFEAENGLKLEKPKAYYVKKSAGVKLNDKSILKPGVTAETGYKFVNWDQEDTLVIRDDIVVTAKATKLDKVIPEKDDMGNPNEKPKDYKEVTFVLKTDDESKGKLEGVTKFYVNPTEYVTINPPKTKANTGFEFGTWDKDATIPTVYDKDTTITGSFNGLKDVIPKTNPDGTENKKPDDYKAVTFVIDPATGGKIADKEVTVYYVNPDKEVTVPQPKTNADTGYEFEKWDQDTVTKAKKYTDDTTVNGNFKKLEDIIPSTNDQGKDNAKPDGYITVTFDKGEHGTKIEGQTVYYVNPKADPTKTLGDTSIVKPNVKAETGYKFTGWDKPDTTKLEGPEDVIVKAKYDPIDDVIPKDKPTGGENTKPEGYITVTFKSTEKGSIDSTVDASKDFYVNPDKAVVLKEKAPKVTGITGYQFAGWDVSIDKAIQYEDKTIITAQYNKSGDISKTEVPGYVKVEFKQGDHGTLTGDVNLWIKPGVQVTIPAPTVNPNVGYKFDKWNKSLTVTAKANDPTYEITAQYAPIDNIVPGDKPKPEGYVTVKFVGKNGSLSGTTTYYVNPKVSVDLTKAANGLSKTPNVGYKDTGSWNPANLSGTFTTDTTFTFTFDKLDDVIPATGGQTIPKGYVTVKFLAGLNGALEGGDKIYYVNPEAGVKIGGKDIPAPKTNPEKDYEFNKWLPEIDKTNPITNDQTHVAQFVYTPAMVTLTYEAKDATSGEVPGMQSVKKGDAVVLAGAKTLKKENATLWGWEIDGTKHPVGASITLEKDSTATAVWTTNSHTVEFNTMGGSYIPSQKVAHGSMIEPVDPPTKAGHTFMGWTLNGSPFDPTKDTITGETTLVANYVPNVVKQPNPNDDSTKPVVPDNFVKVTVDPTDKALNPTPQVFWVNPNEVVQIPADQPTGKKDGETTYVFDSWNPSLIGKFSGPTTIEAQYKEQTPQKPIFDPRITTGVVATDLNKQPPLEAYRDQIKSGSHKEFDLVKIVEQPKVNESGFTSAKIKIRFTENGMTKVVDVLVYVKPDPVIIEKPVPGDCNNSCDQPNQPNKPGESNKPNQPNQPNIGMDALNTTDHYQYLIGYPDGNFAPNRGMTRAEVATMFTRLLRERPVKGQRYYTGFSDIQAGDWYANTVGYAVQVGIVSGYPDGSFKPNKPITRAEFASIASRFDALAQGNNVAFNDLAPSHWGYNAIRSAASKGWISGYPDNTFRPENAITRAEVTSITNRMLNRYADLYWIDAHRGEVIRFGDVKRGDWYFEPIMEATMGHDFIRDRDGKTEHWSGLNGKSFI